MSTMVKNPPAEKKSVRPPIVQTTVGNYLLDQLFSLGVEHIFGIPGDYVLRFNKQIEQHQIKFINTTRENTAGYMADAYARLRGLGVACITYGVGINIANALSQAYVENSPIVVISGSPGTDEIIEGHKLHHLLNKQSTAGKMDTTQLDIFKHVTVDQAVLDNPATARAQIDRVLMNCLRLKKPVYIEIPRNIVAQPMNAEPGKLQVRFTSDPDALKESLEEVSNILKKCQKPVIWAGHEIQRFGLGSKLLAFAEKFRIPVVSSLLGKTVISENHPLFAGVYQGDISQLEVSEFVDSCDCLILLGTILTDVDTGIFTAGLHQEMKISATSETIEIGHHTYPKVSFTNFVEGLAQLKLNVRFRHDYPANIDRRQIPFIPKKGAKTTTARVFECIQSHLISKPIVVTDVGDCLLGSSDLTLEESSFLACAYFATLGFGTPGAIAAQIAAPKRRVIGIIGDGAFQMTSMELSTAVRYKLDPIIIVLNNHGYGTERPLLDGAYNDIQEWNYSAIPQVIQGGIGIKVETEEELERALTQALKTRGQFTLIEVELDRMDFSPAMLRFTSNVRGKAKG